MDQSRCFTCSFCVVFPRHHSAPPAAAASLPSFSRRLLHAANDRGGSPDGDCHGFNLLLLQCHSEGVLWRGLVPLLSAEPSPATPPPPANSGPGMGMGSKGESARKNHDRSGAAALDDHEARPERSGRQNTKRRRAADRFRKRREDKAVATSMLAFSILAKHYEKHVRHIDIGTSPMNVGDDGSPLQNTREEDDGHATTSFDWSMQCYNHPLDDAPYKNPVPFVLILLPPNPYYYQQHRNPQFYSRTPSASPLSAAALSLIRHENTLIRLTSLSAYVSTLGGGAFLCRYLSAAISLARRQCCLALLRGDRDMALKCRINAGYCYIHNGKLNRGKRVIRRVLKEVIELMKFEKGGLEGGEGDGLSLHHTPERQLSELTVIRNMCMSAIRFANRIRDMGQQSLNCDSVGEQSLSQDKMFDEFNNEVVSYINDDRVAQKRSTTHDDFQRIRIVPDRKWG